MSAQERSTVSGGLRQAAFWVALRQEIYIAFLNERTIRPVLEHSNLDRSFETTDDCTWAHRIVVHCADVIRFCFGDRAKDLETYRRLQRYASDWMAHKPPTFSPIFYQGPSKDKVFPEIWLLSDAAVAGLQHYLANILLVAHDPKIPRIGPRQKSVLRAIGVRIIFRLISCVLICHRLI